MDRWKIVFVITCVVMIAAIAGATAVSVSSSQVDVVVVKESATTCVALSGDVYMIRINDDRVHSPSGDLEAGLKSLLEQNPNRRVRSCTPIEQAYSVGGGAGSSTEAIIIVLE